MRPLRPCTDHSAGWPEQGRLDVRARRAPPRQSGGGRHCAGSDCQLSLVSHTLLERIRRAYPSLGLICWRVLPACGIVPCRGLSTAVSSARLGPQRSAGCRLCSPATPRRAAPRPVRIRCTRRMPSDAAVHPAFARDSARSGDVRRERAEPHLHRHAPAARDADIVCDRSKSRRCRSRIRRKRYNLSDLDPAFSGVPAQTCPTGGRYTLRSSTSRYW
jgi:hypothetical protein